MIARRDRENGEATGRSKEQGGAGDTLNFKQMDHSRSC